MNKKINTICFIFLLLFLISAVQAADNENETLQQIQPDSHEDLSTISVGNEETQEVEKLSETKQV